jgi:hypothetical protein
LRSLIACWLRFRSLMSRTAADTIIPSSVSSALRLTSTGNSDPSRRMAMSFAAQGLPAPYPAAGYGTVWARFGNSPDARFSTAVLDGEPVCVQVSFAGASRAVAWVMANAGTAAASLAQPLLHWDTIIWALRRGCAEFDLVGAPTDGVARYKRDWGAHEVHYSVLRRRTGSPRPLRGPVR